MSLNGALTGAMLSTAVIPLSTWTHVAVTYDGVHITMYVNGVQSNQVSYTDNITSYLAAPCYISRSVGGGQEFPGLIDDARIYERGLAAADIMALYMYTWAACPYYYRHLAGVT
jgi:hypothetical protein